ncbi:MAG: hypothetical protein IKP28_06075 [Clostridia bacterium]|nr:hypothetical protein [Clostridia bacterium]
MASFRSIEDLREYLTNYYGSAMGIDFGMAVTGVNEAEQMTDEELKEMAKSMGIDVSMIPDDIEEER